MNEYVATTGVVPATSAEWLVIDFLAYGSTDGLKAMTTRERSGLLDDYLTIYDRMPSTTADWQSLANIANGTTPSRVLSLEAAAIKEFVKVFNRTVDFSDAGDEAFVHQVAYRLRAENRNLDSEKTAIQKFIGVYKTAPKTGYAWAIMRAIAYSGVTEINDTVEPEVSSVPALSADRNMAAEIDAVNSYVSLTGVTPSGDAWTSVHFLAYGSTDLSKTKSSAQRYEYLKNYRKTYSTLPVTEAEWVVLTGMVK